MAHERKKQGHRKDKKNARMRDDIADRRAMSTKEPHHSDQKDIQPYKPGSARDHNREERPGTFWKE